MKFKVTEDFIYVKTPYEQYKFVKEVLNGTWSTKVAMYRFPKNIHVLRELYKAFPKLQDNQEFIDLGKELRKEQDDLLSLRSCNEFEVVHPHLRVYQNQDVHYLKTLKSAGIFNEPRTGKTPTTITLMKELGSVKNLIVCPASLVWNWESEIQKWYPDCKTYVYAGNKRKDVLQNLPQGNAYAIIVSKDTLKRDVKLFEAFVFDFYAVDEAHFLRALAGSKRSVTAQAEAVCAIKAHRKYALTGTPTVKHPAEIYGILHFLHPKQYNSYWQFLDRYFETEAGTYGGIKEGNIKAHRQKELQEIIGMLSVQRKRKDPEVMDWLPDKEYIDIPLKMDTKQAKAYRLMLNDFSVGDLDASNLLAQLMRLRQLCLDPVVVGIDAPSAKTMALLEWLDNHREPVVVMSMFTSYLDLLKPQIEKLGLKVGMLVGVSSEAERNEREQAKKDFQDGKLDVLLCNIITAGTGHTLDRAETIIFTDKAWNPADNEQAEDRITPTLKERNHKHSIITFTVQDSVDERINTILSSKKNLTDLINEGGREAIINLMYG